VVVPDQWLGICRVDHDLFLLHVSPEDEWQRLPPACHFNFGLFIFHPSIQNSHSEKQVASASG
jgi:hypothetical protein